MSNRFLTKSAVMLMVFRNKKEEVLLQKKQNTGYMDGYWDFSATGHVEENESMKQSAQREAFEEIGIITKLDDIKFATMAHKYSENSGIIYYNGYFYVENFSDEPSILEPNKCTELRWFKVDSLPDNLIPDRLIAINNYFRNIPYHEIGWHVLKENGKS